MRTYLQALDCEIGEVVCDGPFRPMTKNEVGDDIPKPLSQQSELEKKNISLNSKAINALFCALVVRVLRKYGTNLKLSMTGQIKLKSLRLVDTLDNINCSKWNKIRVCENIKIKISRYTRFTDIVNTLRALRKKFSNSERVKKIIRSLRMEQRPKRTGIEEANDLNTLPIDDLISSLILYKVDLAAEKGNEEKKQKNIALKALKHESDEESEVDDEDMAIMAKRFRKFFKKAGERKDSKTTRTKRRRRSQILIMSAKSLDTYNRNDHFSTSSRIR